MDRREFFNKLFIAGTVAVVPYSLLSLTAGSGIQENHFTKKLDFSKYDGFLLYHDRLVAYTKQVRVEVQTNLIDVTTIEDGGERQFLPGPKEIYIRMFNAITRGQYWPYRELHQHATKLQFLAKDDQGWKYSGDVYIANLYPKEKTVDLDLRGSGPLIIEVPKG